MRENLDRAVEDLHRYLAEVQLTANEADIMCMRLQGCLTALERLGCLTNALFVGPSLLTKPYDPEYDARETCLVAQAALRFPGGLGIVWVDSDRQTSMQGLVEQVDQVAEYRFEPYQSCPAVLRGLLLKHLPQLLDHLARWVPFPTQLRAAQGLLSNEG